MRTPSITRPASQPNYRLSKVEKIKVMEALRFSSDGRANTSDWDLGEIEEVMTEALYDHWHDADWHTVAEYVATISDQYDGIDL